VSVFCDRVIEAGWLAAVAVVPTFFNVYSSRVFEPDKITLLRSIAVLMSVAWLIKMIERGFRARLSTESGLDGWRSILDVPLALPTLALVAVYLLSTIASVVPRTSLLGSYQRLQGTYTSLSYVLVFFMMLQGIRSRKQVERFVTTIILTSVPIALYGILQHYGLDPLPWGGDVRTRVAANMGNAIFIAAYLIMVLPLTLYRTVESFTAILSSEESRPVDVLLGAAYVFILALQAICIFFSQSRGPWLGLIGGLFFFFLVLAVVRRWRWLVWLAVAGVVAVAAFLVVFNLPATPLEPLRSVPYVGRLGRVLDKEESTSKVRLLIWQGAIDMILPHPPLEKPDGSPDRLNWARSLIGYGPESMYVAYNRFYPPELAHIEKRNASPDRSHNETFDSLVTTGLIGFAVYMWLFASVFYYGFRWLGVIANDRQRTLFLACWFVGGLAGALVFGFWQGSEFVGVGLPAGIAAGLGVYLVVWGLFLSPRAGRERVSRSSSGASQSAGMNMLLVSLVSAVIAHFVEIHFGIAIAATRLYFWSYLGLLVVVGHLLHQRAQAAAGLAEAPVSGGGRRSRTRGRSRRVGRSTAQERTERMNSGLLEILPYAVVLALILSTVAYGFVSNQSQLEVPGQILWSSLTQRTVGGNPAPSYGVLGMIGLTWILASALVVGEWRRGQLAATGGGDGDRTQASNHGRARSNDSGRSPVQGRHVALSWLGPLGLCLLVSLLIWLVFALVLGGRWSAMVQQTELLAAARVTMGMLTSYYVLALLVIVLLAAALLLELKSDRPHRFPRAFIRPWAWIAYPVLLAAMVLVAVYTNLRPIHADMAYKQADPYDRQGMWDFSIVLDQEAIRLAPTEDFYYLFLGRAFLERGKESPVADRPGRTFSISEVLRLSPQQISQLAREDFFQLSETVLTRAREINPLNTDHSANLGRLYRTRAELSTNPAEKQALFDRALEYYEQATSLSPNAAHLFDEWGLVHFVMGNVEAAIQKYEHSLTIDERYVHTYLSLGDAYMATNDLDKAEQVYLQATEIDDEIPEVYSVLSYIYGTQGRLDEAISASLRVLALPGNERLLYSTYKNLAIFYRDQDRLDEAMRAAQEALARAPESERAGMQELIALLSDGGAVPETEGLAQQYLAEGEAALANQDWARADEAYNRALSLNPDLVIAHSALAYIYAQQGRLEEAEQENQIVLAALPDDYATLKNLAIISRQLGRLEESLSYARRALAAPGVLPDEKPQVEMFVAEVEALLE
jgi:tetratricopeptide (TPR) repeat protein/O-antigen ligase